MDHSAYLVLEIVTYWLPDVSDAYRVLVDVSRDIRELVQTRLSRGRSEFAGRNLLVNNGALRFRLEGVTVFDRERAIRSLSMQTIRNVFGDEPPHIWKQGISRLSYEGSDSGEPHSGGDGTSRMVATYAGRSR